MYIINLNLIPSHHRPDPWLVTLLNLLQIIIAPLLPQYS